jgi:hypothetical protein
MAKAAIYEQPNWDELEARAKERMAEFDSQEPEVRALIHEFNVNAVVAAVQRGCQTVEDVRAYLTHARKIRLPGT